MEYDIISNFKSLYPDIYKVADPMIEKVVEKNRSKEVTKELIDNMVSEIYDALEVTPISNGIESNTMQVSSYNNNYLLRDLLRILILNKLFNNNRPGPFYTYQRPTPPLPPPRPSNNQGPRPPFPYANRQVMSYYDVPYPEDGII